MRSHFRLVTNGPAIDVGLILIASIALVIPVFVWGIPFGNDLPQHYQFAQQFERILSEGSLYPSWAADPNFGFGDVGVRFYPPLSYYLLVFFKSVAGDWYLGSVLTFCFLFFAGGVGVYAWSRCFFERSSSVAAAVFFLLMPYHVNQIYNAFLYAEFAATAVLPFCFLFATRLIARGKIVDLLGLSISFALLILTHLPLTVIGSICLLVYCLSCIEKGRRTRSILLLAGSVAISLGATSFYWIRMVKEFALVKVTGAEFTQNEFDFRSNFLLSGLINATESYTDRNLLFIDLMLALTLAVAAVGFILYWVKNRQARPLLPAAILLVVATFFTLPVSSPIWENASPLARVQFPWRWMAVISAAAAVLAGAGVPKVAEVLKSSQRPVGLIISGVAAIFAAFTIAQVIRPAIYTPADRFLPQVQGLVSAESCECLWPIWAKKEALRSKERVKSGDRAAFISDWDSTRRTFTVSAGSKQDVSVGTFYYPYWKAEVDGMPVEIKKGESGEIVVPIDEGPSRVDLRFEEPAYFETAALLSALSWVAIVVLLLIGSIRGFRQRVSPTPDIPASS